MKVYISQLSLANSEVPPDLEKLYPRKAKTLKQSFGQFTKPDNKRTFKTNKIIHKFK